MSNSHCAAHWRSCVSFVRWIWSLSQSSLSLWLQEQKIYCRVIWPEDNFILREGQRVMGRRKKKNQNPNKQKKEIYWMPTLQVLWGCVSSCFVYSERCVWLAQWGTRKNKRMQDTSPAIFNNSECRAMSFLAVGERWKLPLNQQSRSSVKGRLRRSSSRRLSYASFQCYSLPLGHDFKRLSHFWLL